MRLGAVRHLFIFLLYIIIMHTNCPPAHHTLSHNESKPR